jgi:hypothetical protein
MAIVSESMPQLLQDDLLLFVETLQNFCFDAVGDAELHGDFLTSVVGFRIWRFYRGVALLVVD